MTEEEGKWVYYGELKVSKPEKRKVETEQVQFPKKKHGILGKLAAHRRKAKATRAQRKEHKKEVERRYWEARQEEELKAVKRKAKLDVKEDMLKKRRGKTETLKKIGKGLVDIDRALAGKPKRQRKKGGSKIIVIQNGKVRTLKTGSTETREDHGEPDMFATLFGGMEVTEREREKEKDVDPLKLLFG